MNKIEELKAQIRREQNIGASMKEMREIQNEKERLEGELIRLRRENKYGVSKKKETISKIGQNLKKLGGQFMGYAKDAQRIQTKKEQEGGLGLFG
jgi:phage tail tape-measure protein